MEAEGLRDALYVGGKRNPGSGFFDDDDEER